MILRYYDMSIQEVILLFLLNIWFQGLSWEGGLRQKKVFHLVGTDRTQKLTVRVSLVSIYAFSGTAVETKR